jgi:hypothetical protein
MGRWESLIGRETMDRMDDFDELPSPSTASRKQDVLVGVLVWNMVATVAAWITFYEGPIYGGVTIVQAVGNSFATLLWCHLDAAERNEVLALGARILALLLGPLALIYYLPKTRGIRGGWTALGWALAYFFVLVIATSVVNIIVNLISDRIGLFTAK